MYRRSNRLDIVDRETRSRMMSGIRGKNTRPEMAVRQLAHALGYRFRLHRRDLPGTPDLVFPGRRAVILVHGCFWHRHAGCPRCTSPGTNTDFWREKFRRNLERDVRAHRGNIALNSNRVPLWRRRELRDGAASWQVNRDHPEVKVLSGSEEDMQTLLRLLEDSLPIHDIYLHISNDLPVADAPIHFGADLRQLAQRRFEAFAGKPELKRDLMDRLPQIDPFSRDPALARRDMGGTERMIGLTGEGLADMVIAPRLVPFDPPPREA